MQMEAGLDTGPVLLRRDVTIETGETTGELHDRLSALGAAAIVDALATLPTLTAEPQPENGVTYASKIDKAEARVEWAMSPTDLANHINGLSPFPGAWADAGGDRLKLLKVLASDRDIPTGQVVIDGDKMSVGCAAGSVDIIAAQRAGKRAAPVAEMIKGWTPPATLS